MKKLVVLFLVSLLPQLSWAACDKYSATEVTVLQLVKKDEVLWRSHAQLVTAVNEEGVESLCFPVKKQKNVKRRLAVELDSALWLVEFEREKQLVLPLQVKVDVSAFTPRGLEPTCTKQTITLSEKPLTDLDECLSAFNGVAVSLMTIAFTEKQKQEVQDAKPFWQFDDADKKAKKRMKKI